jgi:hypothetical protein
MSRRLFRFFYYFGRTNIPEFTQIYYYYVTEARNQVCNGMKPKQALDDAAAESAKLLGW